MKSHGPSHRDHRPSGECEDSEGDVHTDHYVPGAVPLEDLPVGLVGAVGHAELSGVVGLQVVLGSLGLDACEQDFPLHVHLQQSKATEQNCPCPRFTRHLNSLSSQPAFFRTKEPIPRVLLSKLIKGSLYLSSEDLNPCSATKKLCTTLGS